MTVEGDKIREQVDTLKAAVASAAVVINVNTVQLEQVLGDAQNTITVQANTIQKLDQDNTDLKKANEALTFELAECQGGHPPIEPTLFIGACPVDGGNINGVVSKYGPEPIGGRWFTNNGFSSPVPRPAGISKMHGSCKPSLTATVTEAAVRGFVANLVKDDICTVLHESPTKVRDGRYTVAQGSQALKIMNDTHAIIDRLRTRGDIPFIWTAFVDAGWMWDTTNNQNPLYPGNDTDPRTAMWWGNRVECDLVGNDLDAYKGRTKYPDFKSTIDNCIKFAKDYGFKGVTIPELIHPRITGDDTGQGRATWLNNTLSYLTQGELFPHAVMLFDHDWAGETMEIAPGSPEFKVIKDWQVRAQ